ncbi:hypothetical protein BSPA14S_K0011 (plasmid) [Borreliella spielmanii A14S]|uniref:Uncharacterized protein n=1 Tax=Borreliella spielmanii A14S TaxID=498742 RepID=C0RBS1_9SPIR|nr:hypothetical protein BSPA14S_K0011 [Borreliella spielmanii A14S]
MLKIFLTRNYQCKNNTNNKHFLLIILLQKPTHKRNHSNKYNPLKYLNTK